jgi:plasmid stability protein
VLRGVALGDCIDYVAVMPQAGSSGGATLTIRNVDARLKEALRVRAARRGHSMEAELRGLLRGALAVYEPRGTNLAEAIRRGFAPPGGVELGPLPPAPAREPPDFGRW